MSHIGVQEAVAASKGNGQPRALSLDSNGNTRVTLGTTQAGEDTTNDVQKVEERYSYSFVQASTAVKSAPGFLHALTFSCNDAAPTAGTIDVYDNTAGSGTKIFSWTLTAAAFVPVTVFFNCVFATGLYIAFTTTNDVNVSVSYR